MKAPRTCLHTGGAPQMRLDERVFLVTNHSQSLHFQTHRMGAPITHPPYPGSTGPAAPLGEPAGTSPPSAPTHPAPLGSRLQEALRVSRGPCLAAVPSLGNLIVFPRLRSITPRRRQNEALKGPAAQPWPAGRGSPIVRPGPELNDSISTSAQPMAAPTPELCGSGSAA